MKTFTLALLFGFITVQAFGASGDFLYAKGITTTNNGSALVNAAAASDTSGNVVLVGNANGPVNFGSGYVSHPGFDAYIAKYDTGGTLTWGKFICTNGNNLVYSVAIDSSGNIYTCGYFSGPAMFGSVSLTSNASSPDVFVVKYNSSGTVQWAVRFGGTSTDYASGIALDGTGAPYICMAFNSPSMSMGAFTLINSGLNDIAIAKLTAAAGAVTWAKAFGGSGSEIPHSIAIGIDGNVIVTGDFSGTANFGTGAITSLGNTDTFLAEYSGTNGLAIWGLRAGSTGQDNAFSVCVDHNDGKIHYVGHYGGSADFGAATLSPGGLFLASYSTNGTPIRAKTFNNSIDGFSGSDIIYSVNTDTAGNILIAGQNGARVSFDGVTATLGGGHAFTVCFNSLYTNLFIKPVTLATSGRGSTVDSFGNLLSVGTYSGTPDFGGGTLTTPTGTSSGFLAKYRCITATAPSIVVTAPSSGSTVTNVNVTFTATATDTVDGNLASSVQWFQYTPFRLDTNWWFLGSGSPLVTVLDGAQSSEETVSARVTNSRSQTSSNAVTFTWNVPLPPPPTPTPPVVSLDQPLNGATFTQGYPIVFAGRAYSDIWGNLGYNVQWISSINGMFWTGTNNNGSAYSTVTNGSLSLGNHTITAQAFDLESPPLTNSTSISITVVTNNPSAPTLTVTAASNLPSYIRRDSTVLTATVKSSGVAVPASQVTFTITEPTSNRLYYSPALSTDAAGRATYNFRLSGHRGVWTVRAQAVKGGYQSGSSTFTFRAL